MKPEFDSRFAWWYLSKMQKNELAAMRRTGMFGGKPGVPIYWSLQEDKTFPHPEGRGGDRDHYIAKTRDVIHESVSNIMRSAIGTP